MQLMQAWVGVMSGAKSRLMQTPEFLTDDQPKGIAMVRLKPGPKPEINLARTPSGQPSRSKSARSQREAAEMEQAFLARARVFGLTPEQAQMQQASSALGRAFVRGSISLDQYLAGEKFRERIAEGRRAIGIRGSQSVNATDDKVDGGSNTTGEITDGYVAWATKAMARLKEARQIVQDVCHEERSTGPMRAVDIIIVEDRDMPELLGCLRLALNAIHRQLGRGS